MVKYPQRPVHDIVLYAGIYGTALKLFEFIPHRLNEAILHLLSLILLKIKQQSRIDL